MALVFGDSFDHYLTADIFKKWTSTSGNAPAIAANGLAPHVNAMNLVNSAALGKVLPATIAPTFVGGFWFRTTNVSSGRMICSFVDTGGANIHVSVRYDSTAHITLCRDATVLATSTNTLSVDTWYHLEVKATIGDAGDAPSGRYEVRIDGTSVNWIPDSGTGKDTRNAGAAAIGSFNLHGGANVANGHLFQDVYILNTTGAVASDFLGPCRFAVLRPVGAGTTAEWTGNYADNWQNVADTWGDSDTTFNQSSTAGQTDQFAMSDVPSGTVHAIQHVIMAKRDAGGARTIRPITRIGGTDYNGTTVTVAATYAFHCEPVVFSPATGGATAWDDAELNGAEFGYELVS